MTDKISKKKAENLLKYSKESEYNIISKLNKIGFAFKVVFFFLIGVIVSEILFAVFFKLDKLTPLVNKNSFYKGIINISFSDEKDLNTSLNKIKNFKEIYYNYNSSAKLNYPKNFTPIYTISDNSNKNFYTLNEKSDIKSIFTEDFYIIKNSKDETAYQRGNFTPVISELYNGKVIFEQFFDFPYIDFINLMFGIFLNNELYFFKYSQKLTEISKELLKQKEGFFVNSYNNVDSTNNETLLNSFIIYFKGENLKQSILSGNYFLSNEQIANGEQFNFSVENNVLSYEIFYKENSFYIEIYKDGELLNTFTSLKQKQQLTNGSYRIIIYKKENYFFFDEHLLWIYFNFKITL